ncbi:PREDICTED: pentatricopeptide repeat-containing protein At4g18975, chloroplastic isoform X2 [Nicotiana attenuata]|uniref:pentatricopeptide repeat-containing protein At4g18975, chloroplastic isoform X2 n=1 Tax=Nicotiana attenuata TaxID=49451 RepID=UPI000904E298|nr:PREDICTED: pentatricopeptide repeat-containing protein At4g18975, chloroplastic isoform X2 [Nicotiana attenuata]
MGASLQIEFVNCNLLLKGINSTRLSKKLNITSAIKHSQKQEELSLTMSHVADQKKVQKAGKVEHHLWKKRESAGSGQKALNLVRLVAKWMLSKGQGATMATYDTLLLAFDMDKRVDEAETLWNMILHTSTRSVPKRLFSRMISLYDHHHVPEKIVEVFADMEELGVKPDEDTVRRVARAFQMLGQEDKHKLVLQRYQRKWKYVHFNGERARVRRDKE